MTAPRSLGEQLRAVFAIMEPNAGIAAIVERLRTAERVPPVKERA
jgi:hypothetical protein